jgi:hypothetical protein
LSREIFVGDFILLLFNKSHKKFDVNPPERVQVPGKKVVSHQLVTLAHRRAVPVAAAN